MLLIGWCHMSVPTIDKWKLVISVACWDTFSHLMQKNTDVSYYPVGCKCHGWKQDHLDNQVPMASKNIKQQNEPAACDAIKAQVPVADDCSIMVQCFIGRRSLVSDAYDKPHLWTLLKRTHALGELCISSLQMEKQLKSLFRETSAITEENTACDYTCLNTNTTIVNPSMQKKTRWMIRSNTTYW